MVDRILPLRARVYRLSSISSTNIEREEIRIDGVRESSGCFSIRVLDILVKGIEVVSQTALAY